MKIRRGFVSNSSSSAFIIGLKDLSLFDLAGFAKEFDRVVIKENKTVLVTYSTSKSEAKSTIKNLIGDSVEIKWTNIV